MHAGAREATLDLGQLAVFRAKVVAPVADAVGFVDGKGTYADALGELQEPRHEQTLRRDEEQSVAAGGKLLLGFWTASAGMPL